MKKTRAFGCFRSCPFGLWAAVFGACFLPAKMDAQQPQFTARVESPQVVSGSNFEVVFDLKNGEGRGFRAPDFAGFRRLAGPSTQTSVTIVNGQYSQSMGWTFILQAGQPGRHTIGAASVSVSGQVLRTQPVTVEIVAARSVPKASAPPSTGGNSDIFVAAELSHSSVFVGQQAVVNFTLYTRIGVESYDVLQEPSFEGFFAKNLSNFDKQVRQVNIRGKAYMARILKSVALFPQQTGALSVGAMRFQFGTVPPGAPRDPFSAFFGRNLALVNVESQPVSLRAKPLPEPAPSDFAGVVGQYEWSVKAEKTEMTTDDALSLRVSVRGNGDANRLAAPALHLPPELEAFDPKISEEEVYENGEQLVHEKTFEFAILPKQTGTFDLRPTLVVFDPDSSRYVVKKLPKPLTINVSQGQQSLAAGLRASNRPSDISPLRTETRLREAGKFFAFSPLFWLLILLPAAALGGRFWWEKRRDAAATRFAASPILQAKAQSDAAQKRMAEARRLMQAGDARGFYDEVLKSLHGFLAAKLNAQPSDLTLPFLREKLAERGATAATIEQATQVLQACEMALFAGQADASRMAEVCQQAEALEQQLGREI